MQDCGAETRPRISTLAKSGDAAAVRALLASGDETEITALDAAGRSAVHYVAEAGDAALLRDLLRARVLSANAADRFGTTPVHLAAEKGHTDVVRVLAREGADLTAQDSRGFGVVRLALRARALETADEALRLGAPIRDGAGESALCTAASAGHRASVQWALAQGGAAAEPVCDANGRTALHAAAQFGDAETVRVLVTEGVVEADARDVVGMTPLLWAASAGNAGTVEALVAQGADVAAENAVGFTPQRIAEANGHEAVAQLLERYAETHARRAAQHGG